MSAARSGKDSKPLDESSPFGDPAPLKRAGEYSWQNVLSAAEDIEQAAQTTAALLSQHVEYDLFELNLMDISTGILSPYRIYSTRLGSNDSLLDDYRLGQGFTGWLVENRTPLIVEDIHSADDFKPAFDDKTLPLRSYLGVPILENGDLIGTLEIAHQETGKYTQNDIDTILKVRDAVAIKLANLQKTRDLKATRLLAGIQQKLLDQIKHIHHLDQLVSGLGRITIEHLDSDWLAFLIYSPETETLETIAPISDRHDAFGDRHGTWAHGNGIHAVRPAGTRL